MKERFRELLILVTGDIFIFNLSLWLMLLIRYQKLPDWELWNLHVSPFFIVSLLWIVIFFSFGLYDKHTNLLKKKLFRKIIQVQILNILVAGILFLFIPFGITPKTNLILYLLISTFLLSWWRLHLFLLLSPRQLYKAILIADGGEAVRLAKEINKNNRYNYYFIRLISKKDLLNVVDLKKRIINLAEQEDIKIIVADFGLDKSNLLLPALFNISFSNFSCRFIDFNRLYEDIFDCIPVGTINYSWFMLYISQAEKPLYVFIKRTLDIIGSVILLIPSLLLFPFIVLAIKLDDGGPLIYSTTRVGQFNRLIKLYKFRTKNGTDSSQTALNSTLVDTRVGKFLRRTRLDELPQLWNVLRGDLSFIGPRPEIPSLVEVYSKEIIYYNARHFIKPGLSGWAQINNFDVPRGGIDVKKTIAKLSYDLYYLKNHSIFLDIQIALKTIAVLIMRTGT